jgi:dephospho-CoA kinase
MSEPLIIGLTGSAGMGKSTIAARLRAIGVPVCDADAEVHKLYDGGAAVAPIEASFPGTTVDGRVDRQRLSAALLSDPAGFARLEAIVHPLVQAAERAFLHEAAAADLPLAVLEIPLLFETGNDARVDVTMVASAPYEVQRERVLARPGMTPEKLDAILKRQIPDAEKRRRADFVVDTGTPIAATEAQVDAIIALLRARGGGNAFARFWR